MKSSKADVVARVHKIPDVVFEDAEGQKLTSFGGLVIYQSLFDRLDLKVKLRRCFARKQVAPIYGLHRIMLVLLLNAVLGYRKLRDTDFYRDDPMVLRILGLNQFPNVSTISRTLAAAEAKDVVNVRQMAQGMVLLRLGQERTQVWHLRETSHPMDIRVPEHDSSTPRAARRKAYSTTGTTDARHGGKRPRARRDRTAP